MLDWQVNLYDPIYATLSQPALLNFARATSSWGSSWGTSWLTAWGTGGITLNVVNRTAPTSFMNVAGAVEFQDFRPTAFVRMTEIISAGLSPKDDLLGAQLVMANKRWTIKSYEYVASPLSNPDGQLHLILSDDIDVQ